MRLKQVRPKDLLRAFQKAGFTIKRQKGSHVFLEMSVRKDVYNTSIALHNEPLPKGTLRGILKQSGISEDELMKLLK